MKGELISMEFNLIKNYEIDVLDESLYIYKDFDLSSEFYTESQKVLQASVLNMIEKSPAFTHFLKSLKPEVYFDVKMSKNAEEMYKCGKWVLKYSKSKDGLLPTLSDENGKFIEQVVLDPKKVSPNSSKYPSYSFSSVFLIIF